MCPQHLEILGLRGDQAAIEASEQAVKQRSERAHRWLVGQLRYLAQHPEYGKQVTKPIKMLFGTKVVNNEHFTEKLHDEIKSIAKGRLALIAKDGERDIFVLKGLGELCGQLGKPSWGTKIRVDDKNILGTGVHEAVLKQYGESTKWLPGYIMHLILLTHAVDADFQRLTTEIVKRTGGECRSAPPKNLPRIFGKLNSDHKDEREPKSCCNIDMSRNGATYKDPASLIAGFEAMTKRFPALRGMPAIARLHLTHTCVHVSIVKNTFDPDFDAASKTFGYRCVLANMHYIPGIFVCLLLLFTCLLMIDESNPNLEPVDDRRVKPEPRTC